MPKYMCILFKFSNKIVYLRWFLSKKNLQHWKVDYISLGLKIIFIFVAWNDVIDLKSKPSLIFLIVLYIYFIITGTNVKSGVGHVTLNVGLALDVSI